MQVNDFTNVQYHWNGILIDVPKHEFCTGAGYTNHTTDTMIGQAKQVMMRSLSPEIKRLINTDITEAEHQDSWAIAIGKVEYSNLCQAQEKRPEVDIMFALTGEPDEEFPVHAEAWKEYVFRTDLFASNKKWNGVNYKREQLEKIVGHSIDIGDIEFEALE